MDRPNHETILPTELWRECFNLLDVADHKSLVQACRFFHEICLPFIFRSITYRSKLDSGEPEAMSNQLEKLNQHIECFNEVAMNPRKASLVRKFTLEHSLHLPKRTDPHDSVTARATYKPFLEALLRALKSFANLREVHIQSDKKISKKILAGLSILPNLEQLSFSSVKFGVHLLQSRIKARRLLINNLYMRSDDTNKSAYLLDIFSCDRLEHLEVMSWAYSLKLFRALTNQGASNHITYLSFALGPRYTHIVYSFLATCPNLQSINWDTRYNQYGTLHDDTEIVWVPPFPQSTIPRLQVYRGPVMAAKAFIPGRPIREVTIYEGPGEDLWEEMDLVFHEMALSAVPLADLKLAIESHPEVFNLITIHFLQLRNLHLELPFQKLFMDDDPNDICLDTAAGDTDCPSGSDSGTTPDGQPVEELRPIYTHSIYMNILHWIAHRKINLPSNIETLYLATAIYQLWVDDDEDDEEMIKLHGKPYSLPMAHSILETVSVRYPSLRSVVIGSKDRQEIRWCKSAGARWTYSGILALSPELPWRL